MPNYYFFKVVTLHLWGSSPKNFNELHEVSTNFVEQDCDSPHLTGKETKMQI